MTVAEASWKTSVKLTAACGALLLLGWWLQPGDVHELNQTVLALLGGELARVGWRDVGALAAFLASYATGGWAPFANTVKAIASAKVDVDVLMALAALGAAVVGHWLEGAALLFLFSAGHSLESYAFGRTRRSIRSLMALRPDTASRLSGTGGIERVPVGALAKGDIVRVAPGERIPVDGDVVAGESFVDESTLTGEPDPIRKTEDGAVFAGTLNGKGSLDVRVRRLQHETTLARVIDLVEEAREARAPTQSWIERMEGRYAACVIAAGALAVLVPVLLLDSSFDDAFYRAMTLLVVASPCALVISIPATIVSAVSNGARRGVLFKGGAHLDALADVKALALDKTGTVTTGRPAVALALGADGDPEGGARVLALAASVGVRSEHPVAGAIVREARERGLVLNEVSGFQAVPGEGMKAKLNGSRVKVGRPMWFADLLDCSPGPLEDHFNARRPEGSTPVLVASDDRVEGAIAVADRPRAGVAASLDRLRAAGIGRFVLLTGDAQGAAESVGGAMGVDEIRAELGPADKSAVIGALRDRYGTVGMVGDGVNDAPALATADVGIAMGAVGSDVALETAGVVVMGDNLDSLSHAVRLSKRARRVVRQNLAISISVMAGLIALALSGQIGLTEGILGHEGSTVVVVFNGLRLLAGGR